MTKSRVLVLLLLFCIAQLVQAQSARVEPGRITAAPGGTVTVSVTPASMPPGPAAVGFMVCTSVHARGIKPVDMANPYTISSRQGTAFPTVEMELQIDPGAKPGDVVPIPLIAWPLHEGQEPGSGPMVRLENAFTVTIAQDTTPAPRPMGPGGQPCDVEKGLNCFLVDPDQRELSLEPGQTKTVRFSIKRTKVGAEATPAAVTLSPMQIDDRLEWLTPDAAIHIGHDYGEVEVKAREGATAGPATLIVEATASELQRPYDPQSGKDSVSLPVNIAGSKPGPQTQFGLRFEPSEISLMPGGEPKAVKMILTRASDQRYGVSLQWQGHDERVPIQTNYSLDVFQLEELEKEIPFAALASAGAGRLEYTVTANGTFGMQEERRTTDAKLIINIENRPAAATVRVEPDALELLPGEERRVQVIVDGDKGWNGPVHVTAKGSNGTAASEEQFAIEHTPGSHEIVVRALPGAQPNRYAYVKVKVFPQGKNNLIAETNIRSEVKGVQAEFTVDVEPKVVQIRPGDTARVVVTASGANGWNGPLDLSISRTEGITTIEKFRVDSLPARREIEIKAAPSLPADRNLDSLIVRAAAPGSSEREVGYIGLNVLEPLPQYTIATTQPRLIVPAGRPGLITVRVTGVNGWNGPVAVTLEDKPGWAIVEPQSAEISSLPGEATFEVRRTQHVGATSSVSFRGVAGEVVQTTRMPVELAIGRGPLTPAERGETGRPGKPGEGLDPGPGLELPPPPPANPDLPYTAAAKANVSGPWGGPCNDPWVEELVREWNVQLYSRGKNILYGNIVPGSGETGVCSPLLYGGTWSSIEELRGRVDQAFTALATAGVHFGYDMGWRRNGASYVGCLDRRGAEYMPWESISIGPEGSIQKQRVVVSLPNGYILTFEPLRCARVKDFHGND